ncbi:gamma carbonic anhydrase family protein [Cryptosporangium japonicum]|uniref:Transferase n=1 Tax=Cryptosporangium japonicum TaxID=80872 RepID=A0ABN0UHQ2_9ACTN
MVDVHPDAWVSPHAVLRGEVVVGAGSRVLDLAVIHAVGGPVTIGRNVVVMEHAVLRGRADHPLTIGDSVMIGPHTHVNGAHLEDEVFVATGASLFPGSHVGAGCELRINSVLHVNSRLDPGTVVPIGWIAAGDPARLFSPDRHEELWAVQQTLDFPGTVYGVDRGASMHEIMRRQSAYYAPPGQ